MKKILLILLALVPFVVNSQFLINGYKHVSGPPSTNFFSDDFNRSDASTLGDPWIEDHGVWSISGNKVVTETCASSGAEERNRLLADFGVNAYRFELDLTTVAGSTTHIIFRYQDADNYLAIGPAGPTLYMVKMEAGTLSVLYAASSNTDNGTAYHYKVINSGKTYEVWKDDVLVFFDTASFGSSSTKAGIVSYCHGGYTGGASFDNWESFAAFNIVFEGDSNTAGGFSGGPMAYQSGQMLDYNHIINNIGINSSQADLIISGSGASASFNMHDRYEHYLSAHSVFVLFIGNNDIGVGNSADSIYSRMLQIKSYAQTFGTNKFVFGTYPKWASGAHDATMNSVRLALNQLIRDGAVTNGYKVADAANDADLLEWSATYYSDDRHWNAAGSAIIAGYVVAKILEF